MSEDAYPMATVREVDGQLVLDDPMAVAVVNAVNKHNCSITLGQHGERVRHFLGRIEEKGLTGEDVVVVLLCVDDRHGAAMAEILMPDQDWQVLRGQGIIPYARGMADREWIQEVLETFDKAAADKLAAVKGVGVVIVENGVAEVWDK